MSAMPVLWIVWAGVAVILLILLGYRGTLTRYEEDQIFLDESGNHQALEQTHILQKVRKIEPYVRVTIAVSCALTIGIIGMYVWDAFSRL